jgi:hypothetical protein
MQCHHSGDGTQLMPPHTHHLADTSKMMHLLQSATLFSFQHLYRTIRIQNRTAKNGKMNAKRKKSRVNVRFVVLDLFRAATGSLELLTAIS